MKKAIFILIIVTVSINNVVSQNLFNLQTGDILFQIGNGSDFENAVINSTSDIYDKSFSHCGVVYLENNTIFVLEAETEKGVLKTIFEDFYNKSKHLVIGRLKCDYQYVIDNSISKILALIGKKYDFIFSSENDEYYCSELIQKNFTDSNNKPIFETISMTFKDKITNETIPYWVKYFEKLNAEIPEGKQGSNPTYLSKSEKIELILLK